MGNSPTSRASRARWRLLIGVLAAAALSGTAACTPGAADDTATPETVTPVTPVSTGRIAVIGDFGSGSADEAAVARLVDSEAPDAVVTVGDNIYKPGALAGSGGVSNIDDAVGQFYQRYIGNYQGRYGTGSATNRFFPAFGNHDAARFPGYDGQNTYQSYFTLPGPGVTSPNPSGSEMYYDAVIGEVHLFVVNSTSRATYPQQKTWLEKGLANSTSRWNVVAFHHAAYSSGYHDDTVEMQWPFDQWGADLVLAGHDHNYERLAYDHDGDGQPVTYVANGLGGMDVQRMGPTPDPGTVIRWNEDFGALFLDSCGENLIGVFRSVDGRAVDRFALAPPPPRPPVNTEFRDVGSATELAAAVAWMEGNGYDTGYPDRIYRPADRLTRGAAAQLFHRFAGVPYTAAPPPPDVTMSDPRRVAIAWATADPDGLGPAQPHIRTLPDGTFNPDGAIDRGRFLSALYRAAGSPSVAGEPRVRLGDVPARPQYQWAYGCANPRRLYGPGPRNLLHPERPVTRGWVAKLAYRTFQ